MLIVLTAAMSFSSSGVARADGLRSYDRVVDLGEQQYTFLTYSPHIDEAGNYVPNKPDSGSGYQLETIYDRARPGHTLGHTLHKAGDATNLLPASISGPASLIWGPNASGHVAGDGEATA